MSKEQTHLILRATGKYLKLGSKGNRYKLVVDDIRLSEKVKDKIEESKLDDKSIDLQQFIRNREVEIRVVDRVLI